MGGVLGGGSQKSSTKVEVPEYVKAGGKKAIGLATDIAEQPYVQYQGDRVAPLSANQGSAINLAANTVGGWQPLMGGALQATRRGGGSFLDADISRYMNPYMKGVIDPAARELADRFATERNNRTRTAGMANAFGGSRHALLESAAEGKYDQAMADLYARGMADAFDRGTSLFNADRDAAARESGQYGALAGQYSDLNRADIGSLLTTGQTAQNYGQALLDRQYGDFVEERDWDLRALNALNSAVSSAPAPQSSTTTAPGASPLGQVAGIGLAAASLFGGSSKEYKDEAGEAEPGALAAAVREMPIQGWSYKGGNQYDDGGQPHIGPYAEDFKALTGLGDGKTINFLDAMGVTMGAVKDLAHEVEELRGGGAIAPAAKKRRPMSGGGALAMAA